MALELRNIQMRAKHPLGLAIGRQRENAPTVEHPHPMARAVPHAYFALIAGRLTRQVFFEALLRALQIGWVRAVFPRLDGKRCDLLQRVAHDAGPLLVDADLTGLHIPLPRARARPFNDRCEPQLLVLERTVGNQPLGDIFKRAYIASD